MRGVDVGNLQTKDETVTNMENLEIEIKLSITGEQFVILKEKFESENLICSIKEQKDIYFSHSDGNYKTDENLRIRVEQSKKSLNYKKIFFSENELDTHIKEYGTEIGDVAQMIQILKSLNICEVLTIHKFRYKYFYKNRFEISLDQVTGLGCFIEIEAIDSESIQHSNQSLIDILKELNLDTNQRNTNGYANLMYERIMDK